VLTLCAFVIVEAYQLQLHEWLTRPITIFLVFSLAFLQLIAQLFFFLHLGHERKPRWYGFVFIFSTAVVAIVIGGSLWIMNNLNYNMMSPLETDLYMLDR
jgi:cytochrome o ubiquinol oxidase operon protein cyoD